MPEPTIRSRWRRAAPIAAVVALALAVGCKTQSMSVLGYQLGADALYDTNIKTVYVPVFKNRAFQTTPYRGMEVDLTRAVVREIGKTTRFKVISDPDRADTELIGVIYTDPTKNVVNRNQQNATREADLVVSVDVLWRDLRDGRILSAPRRAINPATGVPYVKPDQPLVFDPDVPQPPIVPEAEIPIPTRITATARMIPELGETNASAQQKAVNDLAIRIVSLMEKPW